MGKIKNLVIILIVVAISVTVTFVGALYFLGDKTDDKEQEKKHIQVITHKIQNPITVNVKDSKMFLKADAIVEIKDDSEEDKEFVAQLTGSGDGGHGSSDPSAIDMKLRPTIITVLRNKTFEEIMQADSHIKAGNEAAEALNEAFHTESFVNVYFTEFVYQ